MGTSQEVLSSTYLLQYFRGAAKADGCLHSEPSETAHALAGKHKLLADSTGGASAEPSTRSALRIGTSDTLTLAARSESDAACCDANLYNCMVRARLLTSAGLCRQQASPPYNITLELSLLTSL